MLQVPEGRFVNFLLGKKEKAVRMLEEETGATIVLDRSGAEATGSSKAAGLRKLTISGTSVAVGLARECITTRVDKFRQGAAELEADHQHHHYQQGGGGGSSGRMPSSKTKPLTSSA